MTDLRAGGPLKVLFLGPPLKKGKFGQATRSKGLSGIKVQGEGENEKKEKKSALD